MCKLNDVDVLLYISKYIHYVFQLIIAVEFNQAVKIHSLKIYGPDGRNTKHTLTSVFINVTLPTLACRIHSQQTGIHKSVLMSFMYIITFGIH